MVCDRHSELQQLKQHQVEDLWIDCLTIMVFQYQLHFVVNLRNERIFDGLVEKVDVALNEVLERQVDAELLHCVPERLCIVEVLPMREEARKLFHDEKFVNKVLMLTTIIRRKGPLTK